MGKEKMQVVKKLIDALYYQRVIEAIGAIMKNKPEKVYERIYTR